MGSKKSSFNGNIANGNTTTNSISTNKKIMNANNKFWTKISKAENSEGDEDTESEEDEEYQCPVCPTVVNCKEDFLKHFENYHNGENLDLDGAMKDSFNSEVMGVDGLLKGKYIAIGKCSKFIKIIRNYHFIAIHTDKIIYFRSCE